MLALLDDIIEETRSLSLELSPPMLYDFGLEPAVQWLAAQMQERYGITMTLEADHQPKPLSKDYRVLLFSAIRELLINAAKHAKAQTVRISIRQADGDILISVSDDGVGFDVDPDQIHADKTGGFGLYSIRERLHSMGGELIVTTGRGQGAVITMKAPLSGTDGNGTKEPT